ncbi:hypothetical protein, partial [Saccharibacter floricola]|uniref:hypothetical protein n=1 Tax=Saccharibacter floricola TaxID=231053 RepID=UPI00222F4816
YVVGDGNVPSDTPVQEMCIGINGTVPVIRDAKEKLWFMATKDDLNSKLDMAGASQPMKVQSFIATTDNGFTVSFPQAFGGPPTSININAMEADWDVGPQAGTWTATSFRMTQYSSNTKGSPQQVSIMAIGPA